MSKGKANQTHYDNLMGIFTGYNDVFNALYRLKTNDEEKLNAIYKKIEQNLIDSYRIPPGEIINKISQLSIYNNRYMKSYLAIAKQIVDEYHLNQVNKINMVFNYLFYKEYNIVLNENGQKSFNDFEDSHYSSDIHEQKTIHRSIMDDDKISFINFTEGEGFDKNQKLKSDLYPYSRGGFSLLELCCYHGSVDCFKFLITKFQSEITPNCLRYSFLGGNPDIMNECLKVQKPDNECMEYAIISHNIDFVTFLMNEHNIKIDIESCSKFNNLQSFLVYLDQTNDINTCFVYSPNFHLSSLLEYFISNGADINAKTQNGSIPLHYAAMNNSKETAEILISNGADINAKTQNRWTPLHYAAMNNSKETAEILISNGADINAKNKDGSIPLHYAAMNNSKETAEILISNGADINAKEHDGWTPLHYAAMNNSKETAEILISNGADINAKTQNRWTPLHYAARDNSKETAEILISNGADINAKNEDGWTPLHYAARDNSKETAEILISNGADINAKTQNRWTPLHYAARDNSKETAEILISNGADINAKTQNRWTPLHYAAMNNSKETAEILISNGADINAKNKDGSIPLHYAAMNNSKETAEILISNGADINAKNKDGSTPLYIASRRNYKEIVEIFNLNKTK
ncbi:ankyrin repeat protein, putative [Trichomonas vaginalis G3]|uniref:Ankyrin repeat protein, putative n=1 Tax=Trichomonas vaginalis (strain ATCC PRA-98 / G3) TaxID=412133 RepID=A2EMH4_TRIV3|nr:ankyrin repeat and SOCS box-containing protein 4 family [Trichomonas vaginalis G3]EAY06130.1 ankyrin repeat protein, putative [Trichomonas vaginalis G3]KAI5516953.1 ankyrin repeat and SOCS box-containing protein 4 family [Trichomonas vaginalis G3]|eukprot:XP_001318353.1 ankyrin repeat protein [Trichomonas vaginalis G3]